MERSAAGSQASHLILLCLSFLVSKDGLRIPLTRVAVTPKELRQKTAKDMPPPASASDLGLWVLSGVPLRPDLERIRNSSVALSFQEWWLQQTLDEWPRGEKYRDCLAETPKGRKLGWG